MQNLDKTMIDKLIGTAIEQLKFSMHHIPILKLAQHCLRRMEKSIQGVILKMQHTHLLTALRELRSLRL